jgi:hypothetical protein
MAERKAYVLRIPPELWDELQRLAAEDFRSVNAEIEFLLREAVKKRRGSSGKGKEG